MKLLVASLKVHLAHCAMHPPVGRLIGLTFTANGQPAVVAAPVRH